MNIKENSPQHLILVDTPWWPPVVGLVVAGFCFWAEPVPMTENPVLNKAIVILVGLIFLAVSTLTIRKIRIDFDRAAGTVTRTTEPLLPLGSIRLFRPRNETRPIKPVLFAYLERQKNSNHTAPASYCLALATGEIPDEILIEESSHIFAPEMDKVRWLVGYNAGMKQKKANDILTTVNQWLGTKTLQTNVQ